MSPNIKIKPIMAVLCDDVRSEASGKQTVIGMYVGGITVDKPESEKDNPTPSIINVNLWIPFYITEAGTAAVEIRVVGPTSENPLQLKADLDFPAAPPSYEQSSLVIQGLPIRVDKEGEIKIMFRNEGDAEWETLKSMPLTIKYTNQHRPMAIVVPNET